MALVQSSSVATTRARQIWDRRTGTAAGNSARGKSGGHERLGGHQIRARSLLHVLCCALPVAITPSTRRAEGLAAYIIALVTFALAGGLFRTIAKLVGHLDEQISPGQTDESPRDHT